MKRVYFDRKINIYLSDTEKILIAKPNFPIDRLPKKFKHKIEVRLKEFSKKLFNCKKGRFEIIKDPDTKIAIKYTVI